MPCPDCGCSVGEFRFADSVETHGLDCGPYEYRYEEYIVCRGCDGRFDLEEWSAAEPDTIRASDLVSSEPLIQVTVNAEDHAEHGV